MWRTALAADVASIDGFFIDERLHEALAHFATSAASYQILERGPAHVNVSRIPAVDTDGAALTLATMVTRMLTFNAAIRKFVEPVTTTTQST